MNIQMEAVFNHLSIIQEVILIEATTPTIQEGNPATETTIDV